MAGHVEIERDAIAASVRGLETVGDDRFRIKTDSLACVRSLLRFESAARDGLLRDHERGSGHSAGGNRFRGVHVFFQEQGRNAQDVADGIEAVAGIVRRQLLVHFEVKAGQVADGIAILDAIDSANSDTAGIRILGINTKGIGFDPLLQLLLLLARRTRLFGWRHETRASVLQNFEPEVVIEQGVVGLKFVKGDVALFLAITVAIIAILREQRLNLFSKVSRSRNFRRRGARTENKSKHASRQPQRDLTPYRVAGIE